MNMNVSSDYTKLLVADIGWKIYYRMIRLVSIPYRLFISNRSLRLKLVLRTLMIFPFSAPGKPGYEVSFWSEKSNSFTHWTNCPPQTFVRQLINRFGDNGELDAFNKSWCLYDWAAADVIVNDGKHGHYTRSKTLSNGDNICDMCWYGKAFDDKMHFNTDIVS